MNGYATFFQKKIQELRSEHRYRVFTDLERFQKNPPFASWHPPIQHEQDPKPRTVAVWCTNDYLGLSHHPETINAQIKATETYGTSSGGTRNISGTTHLHNCLEKKVAELHQKERALLFSSGYVANEATLTTLGEQLPNLVFLSDKNVHASMIQGMRHSRAERIIFKHSDLNDLENKLKSIEYNRPKVIVFVSVYSMDGDIAPIKEISALAKKYNALTYLDEVHGVGVYGQGGAGVSAELGLASDIDIIQGNFAKGFGGFGGYIAGSDSFVDFIRGYASGFIFTTSLPPAITAAGLAAMDVLAKDPSIQESFHERVAYLKDKLTKSIVPFYDTGSHIIPIIVGDAARCNQLSYQLLTEHNIYVQPINYPTVNRGSERLRITITPHHSFELIDHFVSALSEIWQRLELKIAA
ncbi:MAG: 5-aminolevulinate synthase [Candidatus Paracaedibacteraceae bacterium]|nr:5-aminolevulinate synthase [Candidatus Paracaedibacteraceae bacterium]